MTLYINVLRTENMLEEGLLVVEGSKAGLLACQNVGKNANLNPVFNIKCASDDILIFKLSRNLQEYENNRIISQGSIHAQSLTKRYRNQLLGYNMGSNQPTSQIRTSDIRNSSTGNEQLFRSSGIRNSSLPQSSLNYDVQLFSPEEKYSGLLHTTISYDPVSHFEGQFCSAAQKKRVENKQKVALFKGKCPTKNLFSILDPACENQQNKFIESIYKDGELTYKQL